MYHSVFDKKVLKFRKVALNSSFSVDFIIFKKQLWKKFVSVFHHVILLTFPYFLIWLWNWEPWERGVIYCYFFFCNPLIDSTFLCILWKMKGKYLTHFMSVVPLKTLEKLWYFYGVYKDNSYINGSINAKHDKIFLK